MHAAVAPQGGLRIMRGCSQIFVWELFMMLMQHLGVFEPAAAAVLGQDHASV